MIKFLIGVVFTLAIVYPAITKDVFGTAVDTANTVIITAMDKIS